MKSFKITQSITDRQDASLGLYFKEVSKLSMLDPEEEIVVARRAKNGDEKAIQELVKANLRFVISVAKQYQGKGLPLVDLIQEGTIGCVQAAKMFDPDRGFRFISYAVWWIRQSIMKALSDYRNLVRLPTNQISHLNKLNRVSEKFEQLNGRIPSTTELEKETNIDSSKINKILSFNKKTVSLEKSLSCDENVTLLDIIPNDDVIDPDDSLNQTDLENIFEFILTKLSYRERDILRMSFGIGIEPLSNKEIAERFDLGTERVRQILQDSLSYIRKHYSKELKIYCE